MVIVQRGRRGRKPTGGRYKVITGKRKYESASAPTLTRVGTTKHKTTRTLGGSKKTRVIVAQIANVYDPKSKKYTKTAVKSVKESPANRHFVRRNVIVKGTIITTDAGDAKVTSRPGQDGTINAILI